MLNMKIYNRPDFGKVKIDRYASLKLILVSIRRSILKTR